MFPHGDTVYRVAMAQHQQLLAEAAKGRLANQARVGRGREPSLVTSVKHAVGVALIFAGQHIQGASWAEAGTSAGSAIGTAGATR